MGFLKIERKFYDTALVDGLVLAPTGATGGEFDPSATSMVSTPVQGPTEQNRDGKEISMLSLYLKGKIAFDGEEDQTGPTDPQSVFVAVVLDTQSNAAQMNSEDCFKNTSANATMAPAPMKNLLFGSRFRILKSKRFTFQLMETAYAQNAMNYMARHVYFDWFIRLKGLKVKFNAGTTASIANVIDNSLHIIAFASTTDPQAKISYNARLRFVG